MGVKLAAHGPTGEMQPGIEVRGRGYLRRLNYEMDTPIPPDWPRSANTTWHVSTCWLLRMRAGIAAQHCRRVD